MCIFVHIKYIVFSVRFTLCLYFNSMYDVRIYKITPFTSERRLLSLFVIIFRVYSIFFFGSTFLFSSFFPITTFCSNELYSTFSFHFLSFHSNCWKSPSLNFVLSTRIFHCAYEKCACMYVSVCMYARVRVEKRLHFPFFLFGTNLFANRSNKLKAVFFFWTFLVFFSFLQFTFFK